MAAKILVVDDSNTLRKSIEFVLSESGYKVIEACDGLDGLDKLDIHDIQLILTDVNMPNLDGIGFIEKIREHPIHKFVPIIVLTTESQGSMMEKGKTAGATGWIVKPFKGEELVKVIKKVLGY